MPDGDSEVPDLGGSDAAGATYAERRARWEATASRVIAHVLVDDLSYMTVGSGILGLPGLRTVTMPGPPYERGARAKLLFVATHGQLDLAFIKSECERMGARDVIVEAHRDRI